MNGFILSDSGRAILYKRMTEYYNGLTQSERAFFLTPAAEGCPAKHRTEYQLHFWKFIDQYVCQYRRNRQIPLQSGTSPTLLKVINKWNNNTAFRNSFREGGAHPRVEIFPILRSIGLGDKYQREDMMIGNGGGTVSPNKQFIIQALGANLFKIPRVLRRSGFKFSLSHAALTMYAGPDRHAIAAYVSGNHGYLYDSNQQRKFACRWWDPNDLRRVIRRVAHGYNNRIPAIDPSIDFIVWTKDATVSRVRMVCRASGNMGSRPRTLLGGNIPPARARQLLLEKNILNFQNAKMAINKNLRINKNIINKISPVNRPAVIAYAESFKTLQKAKNNVNMASGMYMRNSVVKRFKPRLNNKHFKNLVNHANQLNVMVLTGGAKRKRNNNNK
jgi:hypothetical protein